MDSGVLERSKTLYASLCTGKHDQSGDAVPTREVWVSYPVPVAPFNPWRGYALPASSPYTKCPLAIPHLSSGGLDFLLEDLLDFLREAVRRLLVVFFLGSSSSIPAKVSAMV